MDTAQTRQTRVGQPGWIDGPGHHSRQLVWIEFHEDLLARLGPGRDAST